MSRWRRCGGMGVMGLGDGSTDWLRGSCMAAGGTAGCSQERGDAWSLVLLPPEGEQGWGPRRDRGSGNKVRMLRPRLFTQQVLTALPPCLAPHRTCSRI